MKSRAISVIVAVLCFWACSEEANVQVSRDIAVGAYSEFLTAGEVESQLDLLWRQNVSVTVAVQATEIGDEDLASLVRAMNARGVEVRLWLVLERDQGYWPNEENLDLFADEVTRLLDWLDDEGLGAEAIVYDMEPGLAYSEQIRVLDPANLDEILALMSSHIDDDAFAASRALLTASVEEVHSRGLRAVCVTYPQVLDDFLDGDDDMQDALDIPVRDVPFDEVAFMVYQSYFALIAGEWIGPALVRTFARDAVDHYGAAAVIALGKVGSAGIFESEENLYESPEILTADVAAAAAEGITRIEIYSLDGMVELNDTDDWLDATITEPQTGGTSATADIVRAFVQTLDVRLDH